MNQQMWADTSPRRTCRSCKRKVATFSAPVPQPACGMYAGRMLEPLELIQQAAEVFDYSLLTGKHVVITAGPTREAIDPVRYITNKSSGKMGFALAEAAAEAGARVTLIAGPVNLPTPNRVDRIDVVRAVDMYETCMKVVETGCDVFIATAAVADYRPTVTADHKIKKSTEEIHLTLVKNPDIVASVAEHDQRPFSVGFAAETQDVMAYAQGKLVNKNWT